MSGLPTDIVNLEATPNPAASEGGNANITEAVNKAATEETSQDAGVAVASAETAQQEAVQQETPAEQPAAPTENKEDSATAEPVVSEDKAGEIAAAGTAAAAAGAVVAAEGGESGEASKDAENATDAAPVEEKKEPEPINEGIISARTKFVPFIFRKRFAYFQDEAVATENLAEYHKKEAKHKGHNNTYAYVTQTGKGVLFISESDKEKSKPLNVFRLDGAEVTQSGSDKFGLKSSSGEMHFEAGNKELRDRWVHTLNAKIAEANEHNPAILESDGYKEALDKLTAKPTPVVVKEDKKDEVVPEPSAAAAEGAVEEPKKEEDAAEKKEAEKEKKEKKDKKKKEKKDKKKEAVSGESGAEGAADAESSSSSSDDEAEGGKEKEKKKSRFSAFLGRKEKDDKKKDVEKKDEKKDEVIPEAVVAEGAAVSAVAAGALAAEGEGAASNDAEGVAQPEISQPEDAQPSEETAKEAPPAPSPSPKPNRRSLLGGLPGFGKKASKKDEVKENKEAEPAPAVVVEEPQQEPSNAANEAAVEPTADAPAVEGENEAQKPEESSPKDKEAAPKDRKSSFANIFHRIGSSKKEKEADSKKDTPEVKDEAPPAIPPVDISDAGEQTAEPVVESSSQPAVEQPVESTTEQAAEQTAEQPATEQAEESKDEKKEEVAPTPSSPPKQGVFSISRFRSTKKEKDQSGKSDSETESSGAKLSRRFSKMWKGEKKETVNEEAAAPAADAATDDQKPVEETKTDAPQPSNVEEPAPVMIPDTADEPVSQIGDVVPAAVTAGDPVKTSA